jgi:high affinity sulfate transporter 1
MLAVISGLMCILAGLAHLGVITELLSKPIRYGYMNGIALTVLVGQLPKLFGFSVDGDGVLEEGVAFIQGLFAGEANWVTFVLGASTLAFILAFKRNKRFPSVLVAVVGALMVTAVFDLATRAGVSVLGVIPQGLPSFGIPRITFGDIAPLLTGALAISVVSFADTSVLSRSLAAKTGSYVDPNQEMIGLGAANVATGFFQGFSISSSASRTPVAESAGSKTQLTGVTGAVAIALLLIFAPTLLKNLPNTALAAVVISSAIGLFEINDLRRLYRIQRWEFWLSIVCFMGVAVFGPIQGILLAIIIALMEFVGDGWRPHHAVLGEAEGVKGYHDLKRYPHARLVPGLLLFRWDAPLFFANAEQFHEHVLDEINANPTPVKWIVVAAEPMTDIDITAADMLVELNNELRKAGIRFIFAEMKDPVKDHLRRFGLSDRFEDTHFYPTLDESVDAYLMVNGENQSDS